MVDITTSYSFMQDRLYLATLGTRMEYWDEVGLSLEPAGVDAPVNPMLLPTQGVGVNTTVGIHLMKYRYVNDLNSYLSNPSSFITVPVTDPVVDGQLTFTIGLGLDIEPPLQADTSIQVSMTTSAGTVYYVVATIPSPFTSPLVIDISDAILITNPIDAPLGDFEYDVPPAGGIIQEHRGYLFMARYNSTNLQNTMGWSLPAYPESWSLDRRISVLDGEGDVPTALLDHLGDLYVFGRSSLERYIFDSDPAFGERITVPTTDGTFNQRCLIKTDTGQIFGLGPSGVWVISAGAPAHISKPIDRRLDELLDRNQSDKVHGVYNQRSRYAVWFFPKFGDTTPKNFVAISVDRGQWYFGEYRQGIVVSGIIQAAGETRAMVGDEFGKTWYLQGIADGINNSDPVSTSVGPGATTTVIPLADSYANIQGAMLKDIDSGEIRRVDSYTAGNATVNAAFTVPPAENSALIVGGIDWEIQVKHWPGRGLIDKKAPIYLNVEFVPSQTGIIRVQIFKNFETNKIIYSQSSSSSESLPQYVSYDLTTQDLLIDLDNDGFVSVPLPSDYARVWTAKLISEDSDGEPKVLDVEFSDKPYGKDTQQGE